jgi:hypothetical protein
MFVTSFLENGLKPQSIHLLKSILLQGEEWPIERHLRLIFIPAVLTFFAEIFNGCQMPHAFSVHGVSVRIRRAFGIKFGSHHNVPVTLEIEENAHDFFSRSPYRDCKTRPKG